MQKNYTWLSASTGNDKITIKLDDYRRRPKTSFYIGVRGYNMASEFYISVLTGDEMRVLEEEKKQNEKKENNSNNNNSGSGSGGKRLIDALEDGEKSPGEGFKRCPICKHWVPEMSYGRHEIFCQKTNIKCELCDKVMKKESEEISKHMWCEECSMCIDIDDLPIEGQTAPHYHCDECMNIIQWKEKDKHIEVVHSLLECGCGKSLNSAEMLVHREFECELRKVICQWCNVSLPVKELRSHQYKCSSLTDKCEICGKYVIRRDSLEHAQTHAFLSS